MKFLIRRGLSRLGYEIRRTPLARASLIVDGDDIPPDPMVALYEKEAMRPYLASVRTQDVVTRKGFTFGSDGWHPFTAVLRDYVTGAADDFAGSVLEWYYSLPQARNAKEVLLGDGAGPRALEEAPALAAVVPWEAKTLEEKLVDRRRVRRLENERSGAAGLAPEENGAAKGRVEFERLTGICDSIRERGYARHGEYDGDICGVILQHEGAVRVLLVNGEHRMAALAALGYERVPIRFRHRFVLRESDAPWWPQVRRGVWTEREAVAYFRRLMSASGYERHELFRK